MIDAIQKINNQKYQTNKIKPFLLPKKIF